MKINITPTIRVATELERTCIDLRGIPCLYEVKSCDGEVISVQWDYKGLDAFPPNKTVSQMLIEWEESYKRTYELYMNAVETGIHPYWTVTKKEVTDTYTGSDGKTYKGVERFTGKKIEVPFELNKEGKESFLKLANTVKKKIGQLTFYKIY